MCGDSLPRGVPVDWAQQVAAPLGLVMRELPRDLPLELPPFEVNLFWHERVELDPGHAWLRARLVEVAAQVSRAKAP